jgi:putative oxidoreductase
MARTSRSRPWYATVLLWTGTVILFIEFLAGGIQKLTEQSSTLRDFAHWQYPLWFMLVIGAVELGSALLLLVPPVAFAGAALIVLDMAGGVVTTVRFGETDRALLSLILLVIAVLIAVARWPGFWGHSLVAGRTSIAPDATRA